MNFRFSQPIIAFRGSFFYNILVHPFSTQELLWKQDHGKLILLKQQFLSSINKSISKELQASWNIRISSLIDFPKVKVFLDLKQNHLQGTLQSSSGKGGTYE